MTTTDRRKFLAAAGGAAALSVLPPSIARALAAPTVRRTGTIMDVDHVVILMQENRSFDHYFGTLRGMRGFGDRHTLPVPGDRTVWRQWDGQAEATPFHLDTSTSNAIWTPGTPHTFGDAQAAWGQGRLDQWPRFKTRAAMGYYRREDLPFQFALAEAFTLSDAHHCSIATGTDPNRIAFWSGSAQDPVSRDRGEPGIATNSEPNNLRCWVKGALPEPGYSYQGSAFTWPTLPDVLQAAGIDWRIYQDPNDNWTGAMHGGLAFDSFRSARPGSPLYERGMRHWSLDDLAEDARAGRLPAVSWVLPSARASEHPSASTPLEGAEFTARILDALTANPEVWSRTVFFVTFDENDGLFDHLPPPAVPSLDAVGTPAGKSTLDVRGLYFDDKDRAFLHPDDPAPGTVRPWGLGARVPLYIVSPWSKGGWAHSEVADHTSIAQFIEKRFEVTVPAISAWHRAVCSDLVSAFDFAGTADPQSPRLPDASGAERALAVHKGRPKLELPRGAAPLFQELGVRPSRALPYALEVGFDAGPEGVRLDFLNTGRAGAVFHVYDKTDLERGPRRYTVEAGKTLSDVWRPAADGRHDLWVLGPNGFLRSFQGGPPTREPALQLTVQQVPSSGAVVTRLRNRTAVPVKVQINDAYGRSTTVDVAGHRSQTTTWPLAATQGWYDLTFAAGDFEHRLAGRLETGRDSISDPLMGTTLSR